MCVCVYMPVIRVSICVLCVYMFVCVILFLGQTCKNPSYHNLLVNSCGYYNFSK